MTHAEFMEWRVLDGIEPVGAARLDVLAALQTAALLMPHQKKGAVFDPGAFLPPWWQRDGAAERPLSPGEFLEQARAVAARLNARNT